MRWMSRQGSKEGRQSGTRRNRLEGGKGNETYKEAKKRGEVVGFKSAKRAEKFAYGKKWKEGEDKKAANKAYREDKKAGKLYTQSEQFKADKKRIRASRKK